jgi:hemerythrin
VTQLVVGYQKDPAIITEKVIDFLTNWLIGHINSYDRRLARHLTHFGTGESRIPQ